MRTCLIAIGRGGQPNRWAGAFAAGGSSLLPSWIRAAPFSDFGCLLRLLGRSQESRYRGDWDRIFDDHLKRALGIGITSLIVN